MITVTEIKQGKQVHTSISKNLKDKIAEISRNTKIPQSVIFNSAVAQGLPSVVAATNGGSSAPEATTGSFKRKTQKLSKTRTATKAKSRKTGTKAKKVTSARRK